MMNPLAKVDLSEYSPQDIINPYWNLNDERQLKVYISHQPKFTRDFLIADVIADSDDNDDNDDGATTISPTKRKKAPAVLLWDETLTPGTESLSRVLVLEKRCDDDVCRESTTGLNHTLAAEWFQTQKSSGGIVDDVASTSVILKAVSSVSQLFGFGDADGTEASEPVATTTVPVTPSVWSALVGNRTVYVHAVIIRSPKVTRTSVSLEERIATFTEKATKNEVILDTIKMVKHDAPRPQKPRRILYYDLVFLFNKYVLRSVPAHAPAPWDLAKTQSELFFEYQKMTLHKQMKVNYPYWKPELSILTVPLTTPHPIEYSGLLQTVRLGRSEAGHPSGYAYLPPTHVDEIGLTSEKYIPLNSTITALPLRLSFSSDLLSPQRWRLLQTFSQSLENQKSLGFDEEDIDDVRRLIADTNVTLLGITVIASVLHLLFEFLTFKSDVDFWKNNDDVTGLSIRSLFLDVICQFVILLYLIDKGSSLLVTGPAGVGIAIAMWKCQRGAGLALRRCKGKGGFLGLEIVATRLRKRDDGKDERGEKEKNMEALSIETDRLATTYIGSLLLPFILSYIVYALVREEHTGWYSYMVTTLSSVVYAVGFVLMTPQLFLNYKLQSVAHLPWKVLCYKFLNTFIDDLFAFIIRMPTMARISCFRDDVVFFIYLYQRWLYEVDESRPVEGGGAGKILKDEDKKQDNGASEGHDAKTDGKVKVY